MTLRTSRPAFIILSLALLSCGGGSSTDPNSTKSPASAQEVTGSGAGSSVCTPQASNQGIEGTGRRQQQMITGQITGIPNANGTMTVGSACVSTTGAAVFNGDVPATLGDLKLNQVITALGTFDLGAGTGQASSIYIQTGAPVTTQEVEIFAPTVRGTWYTFDGPEIAVSPTATVVIDGVSVPVAGLSIAEGEVAFVTGNIVFDADHNPGGLMTADRVEISHIVDGPVDSVDLAHNRLIVLGLTILVDGATAGGGVGSIQVGERVTVAGYATASDQVVAKALNPSAPTGDFLVTAFVTSIDSTQQRMMVGNLLVDTSAATLQGFAATGPAVGDRIRLHGTLPTTTLSASSISYLSSTLVEPSGTIAELHGVVTAVGSGGAAAVDGYSVVLSAAAEQSCGSPPVVNALVTLKGTVQSDGVVLADVFCFDAPPGYVGINVTGRVDAIDPTFGTLSVLGFDVLPSLATRVTFGSKTASLSDIQIGDYLLTEGGGGFVDGVVVASQLVRYASPTAAEIEAAYHNIKFADPLVYVHGRAIATDANTQFNFVGPVSYNNMESIDPMTRELFFSNPHYFPYWDKNCTPTLRFMVDQNPDGSLTATSVLWEPDYC